VSGVWQILANTVEESVHDESCEVVSFVAKVVVNHVLATHVIRCHFWPPDDFLGRALGIGLSFSRVTGDDWLDAIVLLPDVEVMAPAGDWLVIVLEPQLQ